MSLVVFDQVSLALGGRAIVEDLSLRIAEQERVGLVGPNGAGKTTLLRLVTGEQKPDGGTVHRRKGARVGYLPQDVSVESGQPLLPFVVESVPGRAELESELSDAEAELEQLQHGGDEADEAHRERLLEASGRIADLNERLAHFEAEYAPHRAERILAGLGFRPSDMQRDIGELSGGWRMRGVLASLLFQRPDLLLLDEPTNHLDMPSVAWLSGFLERYDRAFVLISHDREFLDEQVRRVVSFEPEGVRSYDGNFEQYLRQREEELTVLRARAENLAKERERAQKFIDRFRAKASKASQVQSRVKQLEKMEQVELPDERRVMSFRFPPTAKPGRQVLGATGIRKAFGEQTVLDGIDLQVERGERIALIGVNGAGKTTLLRILAGELQADAGEVELGYRVSLGYYAQHHAEVLRDDQSAYDAVAERSPDGNRTAIRGVLGALMMGEDDVDKRVGVLSGGERARVALARLLIDPGNVLLMDEPTNHLDLGSSESLGQALGSFDGTLLFVSHNRRFLRSLATKIWHVDAGKVEAYPGSLDDYMHAIRQRYAEAGDGEAVAEAVVRGDVLPAAGGGDGGRPRQRESDKDRKRREAEQRAERHRRTAPLKERIRELEARMEQLEATKAEQQELLGDPALYEDAARRDEVTRAFRETSDELETVTAEWMETQEQLEQIEQELG